MKLKEAMENYPMHETLVGFYDCESSFICDNIEQLADADEWVVPPFTLPQEGYFNFVRYMGDHKFECWTFSYYRVSGYLTVDDYDNFIPMVYSEDFGWEEAFDGVYDTIIAPDEYGKTVTVEDVAMHFDEESYNDGTIFTSIEQLRNFVREGKF